MDEWIAFAETKDAVKTLNWLHQIAISKISGRPENKKFDIKAPQFYGKNGIFVTLVKNNKVRGCYGSFVHSSVKFKEVLKKYLIAALRHDLRYKPLGIEEIKDAKVILTITTPCFQISDIEGLDISRYGIMIKQDSLPGIVIVPAEIKTISYLKKIIAKYPKAALFAFRAVTIQ